MSRDFELLYIIQPKVNGKRKRYIEEYKKKGWRLFPFKITNALIFVKKVYEDKI